MVQAAASTVHHKWKAQSEIWSCVCFASKARGGAAMLPLEPATGAMWPCGPPRVAASAAQCGESRESCHHEPGNRSILQTQACLWCSSSLWDLSVPTRRLCWIPVAKPRAGTSHVTSLFLPQGLGSEQHRITLSRILYLWFVKLVYSSVS